MVINILEYLEKTVERVPSKIAFADEEINITFKEVYDKARSIGSFLYEQGLRKEPIVVFMKKSPKAITSFLGVLYSGSYYVPIDEEMPRHRVELILENLKPKAMICDRESYELSKEFNFKGKTYLYECLEHEDIDTLILKKVRDKAIDIDPMYIVFTSGSTGIPKGVIANHRSVIDYVESLSEVLEINEDTVFGNQAPLYFDACLKEIVPTLMFGATTYLIPKQYFMSPIKLIEFLNEYKINTTCWVVSGYTIVSSLGALSKIRPQYLKTAAFVSEVFPVKQFTIWRESCPNVNFYNLYGPTEVTGICCYYKVERDFKIDEVIPVGKPFRNTGLLLLKEDDTEVEQGEIGEICVRGTCLTLGYFNDSIRTKEVFVQNPLNKAYDELIYRTGDLGKFNQDGDLVFVSRKDYQIKHMGHRIELGEIEVIVNTLEGIQSCCCIFDQDSKKIVLYYSGDIEKKGVTSYLKGKLPRYMLPNKVICLDILPLTANGKIDRKLLKEKYSNNEKRVVLMKN